jgi:hypothetical protein
MLSCHQEQNIIDGKKRIVLNPSESQKREFDTVTFSEGEVWGIDILVSSTEDGKVRETPDVLLVLGILFLTLTSEGSIRRISDDHLPKGLHRDISA